ncbi:hypothetical protein BpHYR1_005217 [Brachionus plicatilis]|uniref:Uncharacterized protein n=1 Tax=Brachionus plicatilis TaxID=10195 RepID=A0A3M7PSC8_BRAPC|nr:hypothetical protein BpHYR1_005217 [Brachionus plicatilis]
MCECEMRFKGRLYKNRFHYSMSLDLMESQYRDILLELNKSLPSVDLDQILELYLHGNLYMYIKIVIPCKILKMK